jgi:3',5'-cyclic AMP phosphodiesterase CpdA
MTQIIDPRMGDAEDDASSTKRRSLFALAGSLVAEISLPKLVLAWVLLIGLPGFLLGIVPLVVSAWLGKVSMHASEFYGGLWPVVILSVLGILGWLGGRPAFRLFENSFWSLHALGIQPAYAICREGLRHVLEGLLPSGVTTAKRNAVRAAGAAMSGLLIGAVAFALAAAAWPASRWMGSLTDLTSPHLLVPIAFANAVVIFGVYFAFAAVAWGVADAAMAQPRDLFSFATCPEGGRKWRVAHLSDIHVVGERYGFRVESGRSGPRGNERLAQAMAKLDAVHASNPLDHVLITGDITDAGRSAEWAEFFDALAQYPRVAELVLALPGNHDLNVVDRANPARLDLPMSPKKRLRQIRTMSALSTIQGANVHIVDRETRRLGQTLEKTLAPHKAEIAAFADKGSIGLSISLARLWTIMFPMVKPPDTEDGLGIIILNSNAETHFSFTNALGIVSSEQAKAIDAIADQYPRAYWLVALHHHLVEYPKPVKKLSERIGTTLINGSWFMRHLGRLDDHAVVMHGHRHIDWIGECAGLIIVSAPSPVMGGTDDRGTYFYIHTLVQTPGHKLRLLAPERVDLPGRQSADGLPRA